MIIVSWLLVIPPERSEVRLVVEEYSINIEVYLAREYGVYGSKNVGMSSKKAGENPAHLKSKVSWAMFVNPGLVGPNRASERM